MRTIRLLLAVALLLTVAAIPGEAQQLPEQCRPNGCGPGGWLGWFVPNSPLGCKFASACDAHDVCYSGCVAGCSAAAGTERCDGDCRARIEAKNKCDTDFRDKMIEENPGSATCRKLAEKYYEAVSQCGCKFFNGYIALAGRMSPAARQAFARTARALEEFKEFAEQNPGNARAAEIEQGLRAFRFFGLCDDNDFRFSVEEGQPVVAIEARDRMAQPSIATRRGGETVQLRRTVSGIDVTNAQLDGRRFDLKEQAPKLPAEQLRTLNQIEKFQ